MNIQNENGAKSSRQGTQKNRNPPNAPLQNLHPTENEALDQLILERTKVDIGIVLSCEKDIVQPNPKKNWSRRISDDSVLLRAQVYFIESSGKYIEPSTVWVHDHVYRIKATEIQKPRPIVPIANTNPFKLPIVGVIALLSRLVDDDLVVDETLPTRPVEGKGEPVS